MGAWANASRNCNPFRAVPPRPVPPAPPTPSRRRAGGPPSGSPSRPDTIAPVHPVAPEPMPLLKPRELRTRAAVLKPPQNPVRECGTCAKQRPAAGQRHTPIPPVPLRPTETHAACRGLPPQGHTRPVHHKLRSVSRTGAPANRWATSNGAPTVVAWHRVPSFHSHHWPEAASALRSSAAPAGHLSAADRPARRPEPPDRSNNPSTPSVPVPGPARWPGPPSGGRSWPRSSPRPANGGPTVTDRGVPSRREHRARPCAVEEVTLGPWKHRMSRGKPPLRSAS